MLFVFSYLTAANALSWNTFAPISEASKDYYQVGSMAINSLAMLFMIVYVPGIFPSAYVIDNYNLRTGLLLGAGFNAVGACIRVLPWPIIGISESAPYCFIPVFVGQTLCATAQIFIVAMPPKLAQVDSC